MTGSIESTYPGIGAFLYLVVLVWTLYVGSQHAASHPRHALRAWGRVRPAIYPAVAAWVVILFTMVYRVPGDLLIPGIHVAAFDGFQFFGAWVALPAGLWWTAQAGTGAGYKPPGWLRGPVLMGILAVVLSEGVMQMAVGLAHWDLLPFEPRASPEVERLYGPGGWREAGLLLSVLLAAPVEEVIFRLVLQGRLEVWAARRGWSALVPIVLASFVWTVGHAGIVEPQGVKEIQIFLLGVLLGWTRRRWGMVGAIVAHGMLNGYVCISQIIQWIHP